MKFSPNPEIIVLNQLDRSENGPNPQNGPNDYQLLELGNRLTNEAPASSKKLRKNDHY